MVARLLWQVGLCCGTLVASVPRSALGQAAEVDRFVEDQLRQHRIPGLALVVLHDGKVVASRGYGMASVEFQIPATPATIFQIASASKSFTATAVMLLVQDGKFATADSITKLLPGLPAQWAGVTVRQLLSHTSGLPDVLERAGAGPVLYKTHDEAIKGLSSRPTAAAPGERWAYNQTNYLLLQDLVEKASGMPFVRFVQTRIFDRLDLKSAVFDSRTVAPLTATNYQVGEDGRLQRRINDAGTIPFLYSAGGISISAEDFARFGEALRAGGLLQPKSLEEAWTGVATNDGKKKIPVGRGFEIEYGYGFVVDEAQGHRSVGHSGGGTAAFRIFRDDRYTVVVLHNGQGLDPDRLLAGIAAKYIEGLPKPPGA